MNYSGIITCFIAAIILTPFVKKLAILIGAVDKPNHRKVHQKMMPRLGGLAIYISFLIGFLLFLPQTVNYWSVVIGATIIMLVGILDDVMQLSAKLKFGGQLIAAMVPVFGGYTIEFITVPFGDRIEFGAAAIPLTIIWIVAITNAINLIDGLDGLAAGVSSIALLTISVLAISMGNYPIALISLMLLGSTLGFLVYNFHPAKIFMGDTGSLFLGYMISVIAVMGLFKNVALFSLMVPIIILAIPILDTLFAIIRRIVHKKPLASPDKFHLHHCIIRMGYSHSQTVIMIYALSGLFSLAAVILTRSAMWGTTITLLTVLIVIELIVEVTGIVSERYRPILNWIETSKEKTK
ncbi:undecaprenyl/decaprenyl-phosphate alpha-N-acetylglucosaminyl 1-phosphate transferase [Virgibacillus dakarensis]|uniref:Undecaprenyl-phosphate alpha-N-acetylglucosaminyl 1-phosphate transferase n=1 Tax=Lentibacillus populi TaxID=1827502 RepID=A0A9W5X7I8_9BACI|nr:MULTISPECIES: MraY family glycosyltransferase [Bacillaceae]MTW87627.1 undecaprenyl/decaprenyl-phosphate alpha-N-acetylglucosaminyl 1-phosphate transferase [Virgibacillus dakarensis]GGB60071.1 undecaprenyl-phosphate alpha-N-acetylglucosaminyl 1-phosphate transferase [Lentibacillus populi]